jgi:hypothetical protein
MDAKNIGQLRNRGPLAMHKPRDPSPLNRKNIETRVNEMREFLRNPRRTVPIARSEKNLVFSFAAVASLRDRPGK